MNWSSTVHPTSERTHVLCLFRRRRLREPGHCDERSFAKPMKTQIGPMLKGAACTPARRGSSSRPISRQNTVIYRNATRNLRSKFQVIKGKVFAHPESPPEHEIACYWHPKCSCTPEMAIYKDLIGAAGDKELIVITLAAKLGIDISIEFTFAWAGRCKQNSHFLLGKPFSLPP